jgi:hypothetical protein
MSNWTKKNYRILLENGEERWYDGKWNGVFAFNWSLTLTHLKSGYKVADFVSEEAAKRVGDYLKETYFEEFTALNKAIKNNMAYDQYKQLPAAIALNAKLKADDYLNAQINEFGVRKKDESD